MQFKIKLLKNNLLLGSGNSGKIKEIKFYLEYFNLFKNFNILDLSSFRDLGEPEENGSTFEENSIIKSTFFFNKTNCLTLSDDSGFIVEGMENLTIGRGSEVTIHNTASTIKGRKNDFNLNVVNVYEDGQLSLQGSKVRANLINIGELNPSDGLISRLTAYGQIQFEANYLRIFKNGKIDGNAKGYDAEH